MVTRGLAQRRLQLAARVTKRVASWCRARTTATNPVWVARAILILSLLNAQGCTQSLTAFESTNATGGAGSAGCINAPCNPSDPANTQCCEGARCTSWGVCVAVDGGTSSGGLGPGQACTGENSCTFGFRCQTIGDYKICVSNANASAALADESPCQLSSDCASLYCDNSHHCAVGTPCKVKGDWCADNKDCCSNLCGGDYKCAGRAPSVFGDSCYSDEECATNPSGMNSCVWVGTGFRCLASTCRHAQDICSCHDGDVCTTPQCCRGQCSFNQCQTGPAACLTHSQSCSDKDECCSNLCIRETSYLWTCKKLDGCQPLGDSCNDDSVCCSKKCANTVCVPSTIGTDVCLKEGEPCLDGLDACCSLMSCYNDWYSVSRCSSVAQISNCHLTGEACAFSSQCCNGLSCAQASAGEFTCGVQKQY